MKEKESLVEQLCLILTRNNTWTEKRAQEIAHLFRERRVGSFVTFVLDEGFISRAALLQALGTLYQVPSFDTTGYFFSHDLLLQFPKDVLLRNYMIPLEVDQNILIMIAAYPDDPELLSVIGSFVSYDVQFMVGLEQAIIDAVEEFYDEAPSVVDEDVDIKEDQRTEEEARDLTFYGEDEGDVSE